MVMEERKLQPSTVNVLSSPLLYCARMRMIRDESKNGGKGMAEGRRAACGLPSPAELLDHPIFVIIGFVV